jgi:sugar lactone lactonase YvrE
MTRPDKPRVFHEARLAVGESPLWDEVGQCLWWVDVEGKAIHRRGVDMGGHQVWVVPEAPAALALDEEGDLIVAAGLGWHMFDSATGDLSLIASCPAQKARTRFNDGVVDARGRFWTGTLHETREPVGGLFCLHEGVTCSVAEGLRTQNGCAISPDGKTFYLADSHPEICAIWAHDFDIETGTLANRRLFHRPARGRPDGAAVDAEGCLWFAAVDGGCVIRLDPDGRQISAIALPVSRPTKPAFGGKGHETLFVTTMSLGTDAAREPLAGAVFAIETGAKGLPMPPAKVMAQNVFKTDDTSKTAKTREPREVAS